MWSLGSVGVLPIMVLAAFGAVAAVACAVVVRPASGCSVAWGGGVAVHGSMMVEGCCVSSLAAAWWYGFGSYGLSLLLTLLKS